MQSEPRDARIPVWALPRSLAATNRIDVSFSSSPYLDVSVREVPHNRLWIHLELHLRVGFPIRKSPDRCLFTAPRGLSQLVTSFFGSWCQGIHLMLLVAWTSFKLYSFRSLWIVWVSLYKHCFGSQWKGFTLSCASFLLMFFHLAISRVGEIVIVTQLFWKDSISLINCVLFICSFFQLI